MKSGRQLGQQLEMPPDVGANDGKKRVHGAAVGRPEVYRVLQVAEGDRRGNLVEYRWSPDVRNRDPIAHRRRAHALPRNQDLKKELAVSLLLERHRRHYLPEQAFAILRIRIDAVDPTDSEGFGEGRQGQTLFEAILAERVRGDGQSSQGCPLEEFRAVEPDLLIHCLERNVALVDPAIDLLFGRLEQLGSVADGEVHMTPFVDLTHRDVSRE